jgi:hypothetical protein
MEEQNASRTNSIENCPKVEVYLPKGWGEKIENKKFRKC